MSAFSSHVFHGVPSPSWKWSRTSTAAPTRSIALLGIGNSLWKHIHITLPSLPTLPTYCRGATHCQRAYRTVSQRWQSSRTSGQHIRTTSRGAEWLFRCLRHFSNFKFVQCLFVSPFGIRFPDPKAGSNFTRRRVLCESLCSIFGPQLFVGKCWQLHVTPLPLASGKGMCKGGNRG